MHIFISNKAITFLQCAVLQLFLTVCTNHNFLTLGNKCSSKHGFFRHLSHDKLSTASGSSRFTYIYCISIISFMVKLQTNYNQL